MKAFARVTVALCAFASPAHADDATTGLSPKLALPYATPSNKNFVGTIAFPAATLPTVPEGFAVNLFADKLASPRNLLVLPNGDVLIAEAKTEEKPNDPAYRDKGANRITRLSDTDHDGVADQRSVLISGLRQPYGMVYQDGRLYIADTDGILWVPFVPGTPTLPNEVHRERIAEFAPGGYNNHWTRNIIATRDGKGLFVAVGSASNAGEYGEKEEERRANILHIDLRTHKETVYASGLRNPVGMDIEPTTGALWTSVNERDHLGDDLVPDYITSVKPGGFYGWPYSYYGQHVDPRLKGQRSDLVAKAIVPDLAVGAHVSALGIQFGAGLNFPKTYRNGAFVARHGSWNRAALAGYNVVFVPFENGKPMGVVEPFLTGFIAGPTEVYGRPRSLARAGDGSLLITDDASGTVWRISIK